MEHVHLLLLNLTTKSLCAYDNCILIWNVFLYAQTFHWSSLANFLMVISGERSSEHNLITTERNTAFQNIHSFGFGRGFFWCFFPWISIKELSMQ